LPSFAKNSKAIFYDAYRTPQTLRFPLFGTAKEVVRWSFSSKKYSFLSPKGKINSHSNIDYRTFYNFIVYFVSFDQFFDSDQTLQRFKWAKLAITFFSSLFTCSQ
jgi:hypothetical protein